MQPDDVVLLETPGGGGYGTLIVRGLALDDIGTILAGALPAAGMAAALPGVVASYWISSNTSVRCTTCPGVIPRLPPTVKGLVSTCDGMPPL